MKEKKRFKLPHVYIILFIVMLLVWLITYIVPSGPFEMYLDPISGCEIIDPEAFSYIDVGGVSLLDVFRAIHLGFVQTADIVGLLVFVAGSLAVVEKTGAINAGIYALVDKFKKFDLLLITILTIIFSLFGAIGMGEAGMVLVPLAVTLGLALGYDKMVGTAAGMLGLGVGFTSGVLNAFTT